MKKVKWIYLAIAVVLSMGSPAVGQGAMGGSAEWEKVVAAARKEGKVVVSFPSSAELRKQAQKAFTKRFSGIELELLIGRGSRAIRRIVDESKAGVRYFDIHVGGTNSIVRGLLGNKLLEPVEPLFMLPEVKDPKQWWGGHMWVDTAQRYIYGFQAYITENIWYNTELVKREELRSFEDLLNPKWKGKIGFLDPRNPGAGDAAWAFMWMVKGEDFLRKLVAQDLMLSRNQRLLAENVAKGKLAMTIGLTHYTYLPFIKAGLPVKPASRPKEGAYGTGGSGSLTIIKNPPHPNATKVFANWLLSKEGQEIWSKAMGQGTRRLDVNTMWLQEFGVSAMKDIPGMTMQKFREIENQSEKKIKSVRIPAKKVAKKLLK